MQSSPVSAGNHKQSMPTLTTAPWQRSKEAKPISQAPHSALQAYCRELGIAYSETETKADMKAKLNEWVKQQRELKVQIERARRPPPRPKKRSAPASSSIPTQSQTPLRNTANQSFSSPSTGTNTLSGFDEMNEQIQTILDDDLEESLLALAGDKTVSQDELDLLEGMKDFDDEEGEEETSASEINPVTMERGVAKLLRIDSALYDDVEESDATAEMLKSVQAEIQAGRRQGALRTEHSVLKPFAKWIDDEILAGNLKDDIVDEITAISYLKYSATRPLLDSHGRVKAGNAQLSASSIKKIGTMMNRVRKAQVVDANYRLGKDLDKERPLSGLTLAKFINHLKKLATRHAQTVAARDITAGTILEYGAWGADEMKKVLKSVVEGPCTPTVIRTSFFLSWTTQSLFRLDDLQSLQYPYLQPWILRKGRNVDRDHFCLVALSYEGKNLSHKSSDDPVYTFLMPHKEAQLCAIGNLAAHLQYLFDQAGWHENPRFSEDSTAWNWYADASFRKVRVLPGTKSIVKPAAGSAIAKQIAKNLELCDLTSKNKGHLGRKIGCNLMEANGASEHDIERHGKWSQNVYSKTYETKMSRDAVISSAGHEIGQPVMNARTQIETPLELEEQIFPFVESVFGAERPDQLLSGGTKASLQLLVTLRKFFILHYADMYQHTPESVVFRTLDIFKGSQNPFIEWFRESYPVLLDEEKKKNREFERDLATISDQGMQNVLGIFGNDMKELKESLGNVERRTAQFSPSKRQRRNDHGPFLSPSSSPSSTTSSTPPRSSTSSTRPSHQLTRPPAHQHTTTVPLPTTRPTLLLRYNPNGVPSITASPSTTSLLPSPHIGPSTPSNGLATSSVQPSAESPAVTVTRPTSSSSPPSTPPRSRQPETPDVPSPNRLTIMQHPSLYDFLLPHDLRAFSVSESDLNPGVPNFPSPASFHIIFDAVKQPQFLFRTYGPKNTSKYSDVYEMLRHWEEGIVGLGDKGEGMLPSIREIEARFGPSVQTGMKSWAHKLPCPDRKRLQMFRLFAHSVQNHAKRNSTTTRAALDSLLRTSSLGPHNCSKLVQYLGKLPDKPTF